MSERTNAHNEKRKARFVAAGIGVADIKYALTDFVGEGSSSCVLCDHPIENLFSLTFVRPEGEPVVFDPVGCVCITDWIKALPASPEREAALARIKEAEKKMREIKNARKAEAERAAAEKEAIATLEDPETKILMTRYAELPAEKRTDTIKDIASKVLRYGSFASDKQKGFFRARLREAGAFGSDRLPAARPSTPATASPRPETPAPAATPALVPECPLCRGETRVRTSARGPFFGCVRYPACKGIINAFVPRGQASLPFPPAPARTAPMSAERRAEIAQGERGVSRSFEREERAPTVDEDWQMEAAAEAEACRRDAEREAEEDARRARGEEDSGAPF